MEGLRVPESGNLIKPSFIIYKDNLNKVKMNKQLSSTCQDCGMFFDNRSDLENHKKKFCTNSKYGALESLQKNFNISSQNRDISKFGKMSLAMQGRTYDFEKNIQNTNEIEDQYREIMKQIENEKNMKNRLDVERQKAFRQLQALQKQEQQLIVEDKRNNLHTIISKRQQLAKEEYALQKQIQEYQKKKKQWEKSQVKNKQQVDQPYQYGVKAGKLAFERDMLQQKKHQMELQLNAKRRQKQKIQKNLLDMSGVQEIEPNYKISNAGNLNRQIKSIPAIKVAQPESIKNSQISQKKFDYSMLNNDRPLSKASNSSKQSSFLPPGALDGTEKILKFNLNKQGKSQQDKLIQSIMAQQYDDLLILSKLPKGSEIYNVKLKQYNQLSKHRMQVQQKAQKQRIQKMKRQFQFEKMIVEKEKQNTNWVNQNRKQFLSKQVDIIKEANDNQGYNPYQNPSNFNPSLRSTNGNINNSQKNGTNQPPSGPNNYSSQQYQPPSGAISLPRGGKKPNIQTTNPNLISNPNVPQQLQAYPYQSNKNNQQIKKDPFAYRISVLFLRNYSLKKAIKVKLIIYEEYYEEKDKGMKYQFSTTYHDENSTIDKDPFNPHMKNKLDSTGAIAYNQSFYVPENLQEIYNRNQKQIYLLFIAAEKDQKKITNEPRPYCWYSFKVSHFGQIKQGRFTVNLYGDDIIFPYPADMNKMKKKKQQQITFEVEEVLLDEETIKNLKRTLPPGANPADLSNPSNPNNKSNNNVASNNNIPSQTIKSNPSIDNQKRQTNQSLPTKNPNQSKMNMNYPIKLKVVEEDDIGTLKQQYFYSNQKPTEFSHVQLKKPLNFDVSVSGLRTLPSYIGPVKLQISFLDVDNAHILPKEQVIAQVGTDLYNPLVNFTKKIRNQSKIPPSTIIFIRMIAISAVDYQIYSLGFTLIYLFLDKEGSPIKSNKITNYLMTSGYYQLPIFWGNIEPRYIDIQQLLTQFPPIPCASLLIGILQNASNISNPMPLYSERVYNTILFQIDNNEAKLFKQQYKREPLDTNTLLSGYLQYKGIKKNYSGEQITKYLFKTLVFSPENTKEKLQLKWMAEYLPQFGINVVIDKVFIPQTELKYYYFLTVCISPPAKYYKQKEFDLNFCQKISFQYSTTTQFVFEDNQFFLNPAYYENTSLIIELNRIQIFQSENTQADNNIQGYAYLILPLFEIEQKIRSVNAHQITLPMFEGDFDVNNVEKIEKNLKGFMQKNSKGKKSKSQISLRVLNGYFMNQFAPTVPKITKKTKMYKDIAPQNMSFENAINDINQILSNNYNIQIS